MKLTSKRSVFMNPGLKQLTLSLGPSSSASDRVRPSTAPLMAASGEQLSPGRRLSTPGHHTGGKLSPQLSIQQQATAAFQGNLRVNASMLQSCMH